MKKFYNIINFDNILLVGLLLILPISYWNLFPYQKYFLIALAIIGTVPVVYSAYKAILNKQVTVDLLAAVALIFSLLAHQWMSAVFINLMLTS
jgi:cation transport ATPase